MGDNCGILESKTLGVGEQMKIERFIYLMMYCNRYEDKSNLRNVQQGVRIL